MLAELSIARRHLRSRMWELDKIASVDWCADLVVLSSLNELEIVWLSHTCLMRSSLWYYFLASWSDNHLPDVEPPVGSFG
jgi:hypothetical protein